jgi:flagellar protein FlgJ
MSSINAPALALPESPEAATFASSTKLHRAAQQFEALMIGELLKAARSDSDSDGTLEDGEDSGSESAMDMAHTQFATALATRGGLGLAAIIEKTMSSSSFRHQQASEMLGAIAAGSQK